MKKGISPWAVKRTIAFGVGCCKIRITLIIRRRGILSPIGFHEKAGPSQVGSFCFW
jgi:hypothetical protein